MAAERSQLFAVAEEARLSQLAVPAVADRIAELGRTEDVRFSPSNSRIALAGFHRNSCSLFDIEIDRSRSMPRILLHDSLTLQSASLSEPHGFDFVDEHTLVVANRKGAVVVLPIPRGESGGRRVDVAPTVEILQVGPGRAINSPGSVCVARRGRLMIEFLVCNNYAHLVSRHLFSTWRWPRIKRDSVLLEAGLNIPDGIAVSPCGARLAISNHGTQEVLIYDRHARPDSCAAPRGTLKGVNYPHGLRFSPDGKRLWVADAGSPFVALFEDPTGDWSGQREPAARIAVLDETTFLRGRANPEEGGPKGLDLDASGEIIVVTNERQPLAFFHAPTLVRSAFGSDASNGARDARQAPQSVARDS